MQMKNTLIKINNFINNDIEASLLILANVGMLVYQLYSGMHGSTFFLVGFVPAFMCSFFTLDKPVSVIFKWLICIALILGITGFFIVEQFPGGSVPLYLKWICGYYGQAVGFIAGSIVCSNTKRT